MESNTTYFLIGGRGGKATLYDLEDKESYSLSKENAKILMKGDTELSLEEIKSRVPKKHFKKIKRYLKMLEECNLGRLSENKEQVIILKKRI
ncbi:MAG: hypothetical protein WCX77_02690 [Candidatus Paceibacterota bacterium]|jgi:hypothetical protein